MKTKKVLRNSYAPLRMNLCNVLIILNGDMTSVKNGYNPEWKIVLFGNSRDNAGRTKTVLLLRNGLREKKLLLR